MAQTPKWLPIKVLKVGVGSGGGAIQECDPARGAVTLPRRTFAYSAGPYYDTHPALTSVSALVPSGSASVLRGDGRKTAVPMWALNSSQVRPTELS